MEQAGMREMLQYWRYLNSEKTPSLIDLNYLAPSTPNFSLFMPEETSSLAPSLELIKKTLRAKLIHFSSAKHFQPGVR
jgi:hypothetical protein